MWKTLHKYLNRCSLISVAIARRVMWFISFFCFVLAFYFILFLFFGGNGCEFLSNKMWVCSCSSWEVTSLYQSKRPQIAPDLKARSRVKSAVINVLDESIRYFTFCFSFVSSPRKCCKTIGATSHHISDHRWAWFIFRQLEKISQMISKRLILHFQHTVYAWCNHTT